MSQIKVNSIVPVAGLSGGASGGIIQTIQTVKTDHFSQSSISTGVYTNDVMTLSITPASTSNKVLITANLQVASSLTQPTIGAVIVRDSTIVDGYRGPAAGSRARMGSTIAAPHQSNTMNLLVNYLDAPSTTSAITYRIRLVSLYGESSSTIYLNNSGSDPDEAYGMRCSSQLILQEVSG